MHTHPVDHERTPTTDDIERQGQLVLQTMPIPLITFLLPIVVGIVFGLLLRFTLIKPIAPPALPQGPAFGLLIGLVVIVVFFSALIVLVRLGRPRVSALIMLSVWTLLTTLLALQNGVTSFWPAMLIMPICAAGLLLDGTASRVLAALATVLVMSFAWLEMQGLLFPIPPVPPVLETLEPVFSAGFWVALFWTVAMLTSLFAGGVQRALAQSRAQAQALRQLSSELEVRVAQQTAELAKRTARAEALHQVSRALASTLDLDQVLALITEHVARLLRFESSLVLLADQETGNFAVMGVFQPPPNLHLLVGGHERNQQQLQAALARCEPHAASLSFGDAILPVVMLPMLYGTSVAGVLVLCNTSGTPERDDEEMVLATDLVNQAAVAIANIHLLAQSHERGILEERTRLARDIHDTLAQGLTGVVVQLSAAHNELNGISPAAREHLDLAQRMARESLAEARRSVWNLRSPALERGDLADALRTVTSHPLQGGTSVTFVQRGSAWPLAPRAESALLRVAQEALANVAKHARASAARVVLEYTPESVELTIHDNGIGLDRRVLAQLDSPQGPWSSFGLLGMRERLTVLGGVLELANDAGTQVRAWVPRTTAIAGEQQRTGNVEKAEFV